MHFANIGSDGVVFISLIAFAKVSLSDCGLSSNDGNSNKVLKWSETERTELFDHFMQNSAFCRQMLFVITYSQTYGEITSHFIGQFYFH